MGRKNQAIHELTQPRHLNLDTKNLDTSTGALNLDTLIRWCRFHREAAPPSTPTLPPIHTQTSAFSASPPLLFPWTLIHSTRTPTPRGYTSFHSIPYSWVFFTQRWEFLLHSLLYPSAPIYRESGAYAGIVCVFFAYKITYSIKRRQLLLLLRDLLFSHMFNPNPMILEWSELLESTSDVSDNLGIGQEGQWWNCLSPTS